MEVTYNKENNWKWVRNIDLITKNWERFHQMTHKKMYLELRKKPVQYKEGEESFHQIFILFQLVGHLELIKNHISMMIYVDK